MTRLDAEKLWQIPRVGAPAASADGGVVVVPVATANLEDNSMFSRLWRIDGDEPRPLTGTDTGASSPAVAPDGSQVAFVRTVAERPQVHVLPLDGGEARAVTDLPLGATRPIWLPDSSGVIVFGNVYRHALSVEDAAVERDRLAEQKSTARVSERRMVRFWDRWLDDEHVPHLFHVDLDTGTITDLLPEWTRYFRFDNAGDPGIDVAVAPDGSEIAFAAARTDDPGARLVIDLYRLPIGAGAAPQGEPERVELDGPGSVSRPRYTPDGRAIVFGRTADDNFYADRTRLWRLDREAGTISAVLTEWDRSPAEWEFAPDGGLLIVAEDDARSRLFDLPAAEAEPTARTDAGWVAGLCVAGDQILCGHMTISTPMEVAAVSSDGDITPVTAFSSEVLDGMELATIEDVRFTGARDDEVQMFVLLPPGFDPAKQWPLVHLIHGGPHGVFGDMWFWRWNAQVFAAAGYVVAQVNFHGSTSWGQEFARCIQGEWGDMPFTDIEAATDLLIGRGYVDPDRVAVSGGSYGGYLTAWITSQTDRYRCAVAHAAVTNLGGMAASDITHGRAASFGAEYFEDRERVERWSPSAHAGGHNTPTLVIHGERDYRVPVGQGLELFGTLQAKGVETRLLYFPDENHWVLKPANSIHWYDEFIGWLDRHLGEP